MRNAPINPWRKPLLLAACGLLLMVGGYQLMNLSLSPHAAQQQKQLEAIQRQAQQQAPTDPAAKRLADRLEEFPAPEPSSWRLLGRLAVYLGMACFLAAFYIMYSSRPARQQEDEEGEVEGVSLEDHMD